MPLFLCHLFSPWPVSINQLSPQSLHLSACLNLFTPFHDNPAEPDKVEVGNSCNECIHVALFFLWPFASFSQSQPNLPSAFVKECLSAWILGAITQVWIALPVCVKLPLPTYFYQLHCQSLLPQPVSTYLLQWLHQLLKDAAELPYRSASCLLVTWVQYCYWREEVKLSRWEIPSKCCHLECFSNLAKC